MQRSAVSEASNTEAHGSRCYRCAAAISLFNPDVKVITTWCKALSMHMLQTGSKCGCAVRQLTLKAPVKHGDTTVTRVRRE